MAYEHLINNEPIPKELVYGGKTETVYFKPLTAGERVLLKKGQKGSFKGDESSFEVDLADFDSRNQLLLSLANCTAEGKPVFKTARQVADLPETLVEALIKLCKEALKEDESGN